MCYKCSNHKASLACESGKNVRVCRTCHETLNELGSGTSTPSPEVEEKDPETGAGESSRPDSTDGKKFENLVFRSRGVLEVIVIRACTSISIRLCRRRNPGDYPCQCNKVLKDCIIMLQKVLKTKWERRKFFSLILMPKIIQTLSSISQMMLVLGLVHSSIVMIGCCEL